MKQLTNFAVQTVMDLLIHTNGQTTTLEIKTALQGLDYFAKQSDVHSRVEEIYNDGNDRYDRESFGKTYNVYTFSADTLADVGHAEESIKPTDGAAIAKSPGPTPAPVKQFVPTALAQTKTDSREPECIFYTDGMARKNQNVDADTWVVTHADGNNEIHFYNKGLTRDQVRSRYASALKIKIQKVRACRHANF